MNRTATRWIAKRVQEQPSPRSGAGPVYEALTRIRHERDEGEKYRPELASYVSPVCDRCGREMLSTTYLKTPPGKPYGHLHSFTYCPHCAPIVQAAEMV